MFAKKRAESPRAMSPCLNYQFWRDSGHFERDTQAGKSGGILISCVFRPVSRGMGPFLWDHQEFGKKEILTFQLLLSGADPGH